MGNERANLGFGEELDRFDPNDWSPRDKNVGHNLPKPQDTRDIAQATGFQSREPVNAKSVSKQRRRRTGRNAQFNIKAKPETIEAFCAIADQNEWGLGETLEYAVALLQDHYTSLQK